RTCPFFGDPRGGVDDVEWVKFDTRGAGAMSIVTNRVATLGLALVTFAGAIAPGVVHAQAGGKILVVGSLGEPDTFVGGEGGLYGTAVVGNLLYGQPGLVGIDDHMRPEAEL